MSILDTIKKSAVKKTTFTLEVEGENGDVETIEEIIYTRELSVREMDDFGAISKAAEGEVVEYNKAVALVIARGLVDKKGDRILQDSEVDQIMDLPSGNVRHELN